MLRIVDCMPRVGDCILRIGDCMLRVEWEDLSLRNRELVLVRSGWEAGT